MKIILLGDITGYLDEGMKNTAFNFKNELEKQHEVMVIHPRHTVNIKTLRRIKSFKPDVIHYLHGPTPKSFFVTKMLSLLNPNALTVMSVPKPTADSNIKIILPLLKPDIFLLQSKRNENLFKKSGTPTFYLYPGVNLDKFRPVIKSKKQALRSKYGISDDKFILLHVGHISPQRGVKILCDIQKNNYEYLQVVIVGALTMTPDDDITRTLQDAGCIVWVKHFERIEEIYKIADCYIFPGMHNTSAIEIPLSVLEAMACNLPVITDRFGGLPDLFNQGDGLYFVSNEKEIINIIMEIYQRKQTVKTREKVEGNSWENVVNRLIDIYENQLCR